MKNLKTTTSNTITKLVILTGFILSLISCKKEKAFSPEPVPVVKTTTEDTLSIKVFFSDNVNFTASDYTVTVVDVTNGDNSTVFVDSLVLDGVLTPTNTVYTGNTIKLPRTSGMDRIYKIYLGGRKSQFFNSNNWVISGNVKDTTNTTLNTATLTYPGNPYKWGYGQVIVNSTGLKSENHANAAFLEIDPNGYYIVF